MRGHSFFPSLLIPGGWVLDLGANSGEFSLEMARRFPVRCLAVEANPHLIDRFPHHDQVTVMHAAVGLGNEMETFHLCDHPEFSSLMRRTDISCVEVTVPGTTLGHVVSCTGGASVGLLKMDIEGAEADILLKAPADELRCARQISVEFHESHGLISARDVIRIVRRMESIGFGWFKVSARHFGDTLFVNRDCLQHSTFACRLGVWRKQAELVINRLKGGAP